MLTVKKLEKFVRDRNKSTFNSNLQFQIDASACGFEISELGKVSKFSKFRLDNGFVGYEWSMALNIGGLKEHVTLIEFCASLYLSTNTDHETKSMLDLMKSATYLDDNSASPESAPT
jgi:hypothetical protein